MKLQKKMEKFFVKVRNRLWINELMNNNKGMGVVEIILIIMVLVGLVVIFRTRITSIVNSIFSNLTSKVNTF